MCILRLLEILGLPSFLNFSSIHVEWVHTIYMKFGGYLIFSIHYILIYGVRDIQKVSRAISPKGYLCFFFTNGQIYFL